MDLLEVKDPQIRGTARVFKLRRNVTYRHLREEPIKIRVVVSEVRREFNFHNERPIYLTTDRLPLIRSEIGLWPPHSLSLSLIPSPFAPVLSSKPKLLPAGSFLYRDILIWSFVLPYAQLLSSDVPFKFAEDWGVKGEEWEKNSHRVIILILRGDLFSLFLAPFPPPPHYRYPPAVARKRIRRWRRRKGEGEGEGEGRWRSA